MQISLQNRKLWLQFTCQLLKDQVLSGILQHLQRILSQFLKDTVCKALEAEHIHVEDRMVFLPSDKLPLCRHRKLLRHKHIVRALRMLPRLR